MKETDITSKADREEKQDELTPRSPESKGNLWAKYMAIIIPSYGYILPAEDEEGRVLCHRLSRG